MGRSWSWFVVESTGVFTFKDKAAAHLKVAVFFFFFLFQSYRIIFHLHDLFLDILLTCYVLSNDLDRNFMIVLT